MNNLVDTSALAKKLPVVYAPIISRPPAITKPIICPFLSSLLLQ